MTEITRETLELAALAAGHTITSFEPVGPRGALVAMLGVNSAGYGIHWRPHLDDGDSRRLQVALFMALQFDCARNMAMAMSNYIVPAIFGMAPYDGTPADAARAAREAVVLCAAAVGERMRKGGA